MCFVDIAPIEPAGILYVRPTLIVIVELTGIFLNLAVDKTGALPLLVNTGKSILL